MPEPKGIPTRLLFGGGPSTSGSYQAGGGIVNEGTLTLIDSTIADNSAANTAGGVYNASGGAASVQGTIIAANSAAGSSPEVYGTFVSLGNNLIGNLAGATGFVASDLTSIANPGLAPLAYNGGPTPTVALLSGNPAIDAGFVPAVRMPSLPGQIHEWNGEGNANDSGGFDNATISGSVGYAPGVVGQAFQFNGSGTVVAGDTPALDSTSFTVGGWFNITQALAPGTEHFLASKYNGAYHGWVLRIGNNLQPGVSVSGSTTADVNVFSPTPIGLNTWYYLAATHDGSTVKLYIDGTLAASASLSNGYVPSSTSLTMGSASWYSGGYVNGLANELSVFNRALSPAEIQALHANLGQATYTPLVLPALDQNGNARVANGTVDIGAYEFQSVSPVGSAGTSSGYTITAGQSLDLNASASVDPEGMTLSYAWYIDGNLITRRDRSLAHPDLGTAPGFEYRRGHLSGHRHGHRRQPRCDLESRHAHGTGCFVELSEGARRAQRSRPIEKHGTR